MAFPCSASCVSVTLRRPWLYFRPGRTATAWPGHWISADLGALGFIPKSEQREVIRSAFNLIFSGGVYISHEILKSENPSPQEPKMTSGAAGTRPLKPADLGLTGRQV